MKGGWGAVDREREMKEVTGTKEGGRVRDRRSERE
jgi:hypothetical protein